MTDTTDVRSRILTGLALAALLAATRSQAFAPLGQHLPDASLAVFFLAGFICVLSGCRWRCLAWPLSST